MDNENVTKADAQYRVAKHLCEHRIYFNNAFGVTPVGNIALKLKTFRADLDVASLRAKEIQDLEDLISSMENLDGLTILTVITPVK